MRNERCEGIWGGSLDSGKGICSAPGWQLIFPHSLHPSLCASSCCLPWALGAGFPVLHSPNPHCHPPWMEKCPWQGHRAGFSLCSGWWCWCCRGRAPQCGGPRFVLVWGCFGPFHLCCLAITIFPFSSQQFCGFLQQSWHTLQ